MPGPRGPSLASPGPLRTARSDPSALPDVAKATGEGVRAI